MIARVAPIIATYKRDTAQSIPNNAWTIVDYNVQVKDTYGAVTTGAAWKFVAPVSTTYIGVASILFAQNTAFAVGENITLAVNINGLRPYPSRNDQINTSTNLYGPSIAISFIAYLNINDVVYVEVYQNSGSALNLYTDGRYNYFSIAGLPTI